MKFFFNLKHYLYIGLREVFVYHHNSLEFRAKIFALIISANHKPGECEYAHVHKTGMDIYKDEERVNLLLLTTREYVKKVQNKNGLDIDDLIEDIRQELRQIPRYVSKIDPSTLYPLVECSNDEDISAYQVRMIEFLERLKIEMAK